MSLEDLDMVDRKILAELDKNARMSYSELGKRTRVAKETVKYRIEKLLSDKVIKGFYTVVNFSKLGFTLYRLYLRLQNTNPAIENEITKYLIQSKNVAVFYGVNGPFHIALGIWVRSTWDYEQFWQDFKTRFGAYLSSYHLSLMSEYLEFSRPYLLSSKTSAKEIFVTVSKTEPAQLDNLDFQLLAFLSNNARASLVAISKELNISLVTARYHIKKLIDKKVIIGFRLALNLSMLGREYYKVDLWFRKFDNAKEITQHIISNPNIAYTERTLVSSDLEFDVEIENFEKFILLMDSFKVKFPEDIRDYSYYSRVKNYKTSYIPAL